MITGGNGAEKCGGPDRLTVYSKGNLTVLQVPVIQKDNLPANWTYGGCALDSVTAARPLPYKMTDSNNTVANCIAQCQKFGYPAAGVEYGVECYCGDFFDITATGPQLKPDTDCNMPCAGNASALCGSGGRLQYYTYNSTTPLFSFSYPTGINAGAYQFLIGGVVVPIITIHGINGKVSFLEKFGTGKEHAVGASISPVLTYY
jgi:hypothetical protein